MSKRRFADGEGLDRAHRLVPVHTEDDIMPEYRGTPIEEFLRYHNLGEPLPPSAGKPKMLIGMCMDNRKYLTIPNEFAFILRSAGAHISNRPFEISYAIAVGGVTTIALLAHTQCGMTNVIAQRELFVEGLMQRAGWTRDAAEQLFELKSPEYEIGDPVDFVIAEAALLRAQWPGVLVAPFLYAVETDRIAQIT